MGKGKKTRQKLDPKRYDEGSASAPSRKEKDWSFEDIARSKTRRH